MRSAAYAQTKGLDTQMIINGACLAPVLEKEFEQSREFRIETTGLYVYNRS